MNRRQGRVGQHIREVVHGQGKGVPVDVSEGPVGAVSFDAKAVVVVVRERGLEVGHSTEERVVGQLRPTDAEAGQLGVLDT